MAHKEKKMCLFCSKETHNPKFCSKSCATKYNNREFPKRQPRGNCTNCGVPVRYGYKYCTDCYNTIYRLANRTIESIQGKAKYQVSARIRQHARVSAGKIESCAVCGYSAHVEICHIKPIASYSPDTTIGEVNHPSNLVGLCPNHHWELDNGILVFP